MQGTQVRPLVRELDSTCHTKSLQAVKQNQNTSFNAQHSLPLCQWSWLGSAEGLLLRSCYPPMRKDSQLQLKSYHPLQHHARQWDWKRKAWEWLEGISSYTMLSRSVASDSFWPHGLWPTSLLCPWGFSRQEYWSGLTCPPSGYLPNLGIEPMSPHFRWILYHLSHQGSPRILEPVAYPFSRGSSQPRNWTRISSIAGRFFTSWVTREAPAQTAHSVSHPS